MTEDELLDEMDKQLGPGAGKRWLAKLAVEERAVFELGERIGYGRTMQLCEKLWRQKLATVHPGTEGGEHSALTITGPCVSFLVPCPCEQAHLCDWCCGSGRITKRVLEAIEAADD